MGKRILYGIRSFAYRILQPQAAYAYRVYGILALEYYKCPNQLEQTQCVWVTCCYYTQRMLGNDSSCVRIVCRWLACHGSDISSWPLVQIILAIAMENEPLGDKGTRCGIMGPLVSVSLSRGS